MATDHNRLWETLRAPARRETFDPSTLDDLPEPAARWLRRTVTPGTPLAQSVELTMGGRIRIGGRWLPYTARQILRAGVGFVWQPRVGGRLLRFTGADSLGEDGARLDFRLHGLIPVAQADGPDTDRSAAGRLAAETVAWLPSAVVPQLGIRWEPVDGDRDRARVAVPVPDGTIDVDITVDIDGRLLAVDLQRWSDRTDPPSHEPFGADVAADGPGPNGDLIAAEGTVGWDHGTPAWSDGRFFEFTLDATAT